MGIFGNKDDNNQKKRNTQNSRMGIYRQESSSIDDLLKLIIKIYRRKNH